MTVSLDARTPSAAVHALSGSSAGAGRPFAPLATVHELPDAFVPLGAAAADVVAGLAARRAAPAHPDAEVIDLAGRVKRLFGREDRLLLKCCRISDAATEAMPPRPVKPDTTLKLGFSRLKLADGSEVITQTSPPGWAAELNGIAAAHEAALAEHGRAEAALVEGLGGPRWEKLRDRAVSRLFRWTLQLAAAAPRTLAGLAAKADAHIAMERDHDQAWVIELGASIDRDAVRLAATAMQPRAEQDRQADAELFGLIARWHAADEVHRLACEKAAALCFEATTAYPPLPAALVHTSRDAGYGFKASGKEKLPSGRRRAVYLPGDIDDLRAAGTPKSLSGIVYEPAEDRRLAIIAAHEAWMAERAEICVRTGYTAAEAAETAACEACSALEGPLLAHPARTLPGLRAKAAWVAKLAADGAFNDKDFAAYATEVAAFGGAGSSIRGHDLAPSAGAAQPDLDAELLAMCREAQAQQAIYDDNTLEEAVCEAAGRRGNELEDAAMTAAPPQTVEGAIAYLEWALADHQRYRMQDGPGRGDHLLLALLSGALGVLRPAQFGRDLARAA